MANEMKILYFPLKKEWYEMIESGEKREEYREISDYWCRRLLKYQDSVCDSIAFRKDFTHVCFRYGYTKRTMLFKLDEITIDFGKPEWGAPKDKEVFIIKFH